MAGFTASTSLGTAYVSILPDMKGMHQGLAKVKTSFAASLKSALSMERVISRLAFIGTVGAVYALGRAIKSTFEIGVKEAMAFEKQMAEVYTMLDKVDKIFKDDLKVGVQNLAVEFGQSTEVLARGLYNILSASIGVDKSLAVLSVSAKAAAAGLTDASAAADVITTFINAYGLAASDAADISDLLFAIVKRGKLTFSELSMTIGKVISTAALGKLSIEELGASFATMTRQGIKAREAATALNRLILSFIKPTDQAREVAYKFGFQLNVATLEAIGLTGIIQKLNGATEEELAILGTSVRAFKALAAGVNDTSGQLYDLDIMFNRMGMNQNAYNEIAETTTLKISQANEAIKETGRILGDIFIPIIGDAAIALKKFLSNLETYYKMLKLISLATPVGQMLALNKIFKDLAKTKTIEFPLEGYDEYLESINANIAEFIVKFKKAMQPIPPAIPLIEHISEVSEDWDKIISKLNKKFLKMSKSLSSSSGFIRRMTKDIKILKEQLEEAKIATFGKNFTAGIKEWSEAWHDFAFTSVDVAEAAIGSISDAYSNLWSDILAGENMMKKKWGEYLKDMVNQFILAVNQMIIKWLSFMALRAALSLLFPGAGESGIIPQGFSGLSFPTTGIGGGGGTYNPIINNTFTATFSPRDMGFIVKSGQNYLRNTEL